MIKKHRYPSGVPVSWCYRGLVASHSDHVHSVLQCADDSGKVFPGGFFGAGEIENEAAATGAGYGSGKHGAGVILRPSTHMATGMARISRSRTAKVASGVTSRGESPVPPVVMMRLM